MSLSIARFTTQQRCTYQDPDMLMIDRMKLYEKQIFYSYSTKEGHVFNTDPIYNKQEIRIFRKRLENAFFVEWYGEWVETEFIYRPTRFTIRLKKDFLEREY